MGQTARQRAARDPTVYPVEERVGEDILQRLIVELLRPLLARFLAERGVVALVGADQFIYYEQHNSTARVAPDVYVLPGVPPDTPVSTWKTWETGTVPSFALEVASTDWQKDYVDVPERCRELGVKELVVFDPDWAARPRGVGVRWQIFRRGKRGLQRVETGYEDRVRSRELGCWLRVVGVAQATRLRIALGQHGEELYPTAEEAERAAKEAERAAKEAERAAKEAERAAKEAALARVAELEAKLARLTVRDRRRR